MKNHFDSQNRYLVEVMARNVQFDREHLECKNPFVSVVSVGDNFDEKSNDLILQRLDSSPCYRKKLRVVGEDKSFG